MHQHEQESCAQRRRSATKLLDIATEIGGSRNLVEAAVMAAHNLTQCERNPLVELLTLVSERLQQIAADIESEAHDGAEPNAA